MKKIIIVIIIISVTSGAIGWMLAKSFQCPSLQTNNVDVTETETNDLSSPSLEENNLSKYCIDRGGKIENWEENGEIKQKCKLSNGKLCDLLELFNGNCPKVRYLYPVDCQQKGEQYLGHLGNVKYENVKLADVIGDNEYYTGMLCRAYIETNGIESYVNSYKITTKLIENEGWEDNNKLNSLDGPRCTRSGYYKDDDILIFNSYYEYKHSWDSEWMKQQREKCSEPFIQACLPDSEIDVTISIYLAEGHY